MKYKVVKQPPLRKEEDYDKAAPGLYPDGEVLVQIGDIYAAVSVTEGEWYEGGVNLLGVARWCDADGQTHLAPDDRHVETTYPCRVDAELLTKFDLDALKKDVVHLMLGEEPECLLSCPVDGGDPIQVPALDVASTTKLAMDITHAANMVSQVKKAKPLKQLLAG